MPEHVDRRMHDDADTPLQPTRVARSALFAALVVIVAGFVLMPGAVRAETRERPAIEHASASNREEVSRQKTVALVFSRPLDHAAEHTALRRVAGIFHNGPVGAGSIASLAAASLLLLATLAVRRRWLSLTAFCRARPRRAAYLFKI